MSVFLVSTSEIQIINSCFNNNNNKEIKSETRKRERSPLTTFP